jgi:plastocyanin domain-containing protein
MMRLAFGSGLLVVVCAFAGTGIGCKKNDEGRSATVTGNIAVTVDGDGFKPSTVNVKKGAPATLIFTRTVDDTCATAVVFPELNVTKDLPKGTPVAIEVPTDKEQKLTFQCGMGMYKSSVVVVN